MSSEFTKSLGIEVPIICGPMYPCSNPELVAAVSEAGGIGVVQPISLTFVHKHDFRKGLQYIKSLTSKPFGMNALIEKSSSKYQDKMSEWIDIALEEGVRFFITSLGNPKWVVEKVTPCGGIVYHDVTERKWAEKGLQAGVKGLIAVNNRSGGHAGIKSMQELYKELSGYSVPLVCAGGVGGVDDFKAALDCGYQACQLGTRFIASTECNVSDAYKRAIINSSEKDIVLSEKITGVPVSLINTPYIEQMGTKAGPIVRYLLGNNITNHWIRMFYTVISVFRFKKSLNDASTELWQAGKSVEGIKEILSCKQIINQFKTLKI